MNDQTDKNDEREDTDSRERLNMIQKGYEHWSHRTLAILLVLFTVQLALGGLSVYLLDQNNKRQVASCERTNTRNINAIKALRTGAGEDIKNAPNEDAKTEIRRRRDVTISLINALAPVRNCKEA